MIKTRRWYIAAIAIVPASVALALAAQSPYSPSHDPIETFWGYLQSLCGSAYSGAVTQSSAPEHVGHPMAMDVHFCDDHRVSIRSYAGDEVTRIHSLVRHGSGLLELRHEYRDPDGSLHRITAHGGFATNRGGERVQIFPADQRAVDNQPFMWNWIWMIEIHPGKRYVYSVQRLGTDVSVRTEFDLNRVIESPANRIGSVEVPTGFLPGKPIQPEGQSA